MSFCINCVVIRILWTYHGWCGGNETVHFSSCLPMLPRKEVVWRGTCSTSTPRAPLSLASEADGRVHWHLGQRRRLPCSIYWPVGEFITSGQPAWMDNYKTKLAYQPLWVGPHFYAYIDTWTPLMYKRRIHATERGVGIGQTEIGYKLDSYIKLSEEGSLSPCYNRVHPLPLRTYHHPPL